MSRDYDKGLIYTGPDCNGCNQCIASCPADGANAARKTGSSIKVSVDPGSCIACGSCINACRHNERIYRDRTGAFFEALKSGDKVSVILDETFYHTYTPEKAGKIIAYLKRSGVSHVYDASFGAEIYLACASEFLRSQVSEGRRSFISTVCPAAISYVEYFRPQLVSKLIPVVPPALCMLVYAKKYLKDGGSFAIISDCTAMGLFAGLDENKDYDIAYNLTLSDFDRYIEDKDIGDESSVSEAKGGRAFTGYIFPGEMKRECELLLPHDEYALRLSFMPKERKYLDIDSRLFKSDEKTPAVIEVIGAPDGCLACAGRLKGSTDALLAAQDFKRRQQNDENSAAYKEQSSDKRAMYLKDLFKDLDLADFSLKTGPHFNQINIVPGNVIDEVLASMHKHSEEEKHHDCMACGYGSCYEMAKAIANGYNVKENCATFAKGEIRRLASTDVLTGAPNMDSFSEKAAAILNTSPGVKFVLGWVDIKRLRIINDVLGYDSGNTVLCEVAKGIEEALPYNGCYGRFADDSFVYLIPYRPGLYDMVRNYARKKCQAYKNMIPVSVDLGFYEIGEQPQYTAKNITRYADNARIAFDSVKGGYDIGVGIYSEGMKQKMIMESELTSLMAASLERGDFKVYFQPQYDHLRGVMVGAETLVRWIMDERGTISPSQFVPLFEKNGFIAKLDAFVWEQTCRYLRRWMDEKRELVPVSVNISRVDIYSGDVAGILTELTERYRIDRHYLRLEITESAYIKDPDSMKLLIEDLHKLGFLVEMDDFGSGYSSLNVLKDMPVDILKLDLKFLAGGNEERGGSIIQSVIRMAQLIDVPVIAEGVETKEQADFMASIGCNVIQGFYYARPMEASEFVRLMGEEVPEIKNDKKTSFYYRSESLGKFLSPGAEVTTIFELATGASALFEYDGKHLSLVRANNRFIKETGLTPEVIKEHKNDFFDFVYTPCTNMVIDRLEQVKKNGESVSFTSLWGMDGSICLRTTARLIAEEENDSFIFMTVDNISDLVNIDKLRDEAKMRPFGYDEDGK